MLRKTGDCCLEALWQEIAAVCAAVGSNQVDAVVQGFRESGATKMNKSKAEPISSLCFQRKAGSMRALHRVVWSLIFLVFGGALGECGGAGKKVHQGIAEEVYPTLQLDLRWKKMHCYENSES